MISIKKRHCSVFTNRFIFIYLFFVGDNKADTRLDLYRHIPEISVATIRLRLINKEASLVALLRCSSHRLAPSARSSPLSSLPSSVIGHRPEPLYPLSLFADEFTRRLLAVSDAYFLLRLQL
jgi:hypothetical protein